jgi:DTW domain-containing protein YfiP
VGVRPMLDAPAFRPLCLRCLRPERVCFCARLPVLETRTRVVFLQHTRERRMPIGTARMAHLSLPNSELHVGIEFAGDGRIDALCAEPGAFLLFPGPGAKEVTALSPGELRTLVVVDGTWPLARKLIRVNPGLQALPRVMFRPERPGNYRIRKEPAAHCLSTVEAVSEVLGRLEGDVERFHQLLRPFDWMVDTQLSCQAERRGPSRYKRHKPVRQSPAHKVAAALRARCEAGLVLVYAESNPLPGTGGHGRELMHLVAERVGGGERFEAVLAPQQVLDPSTPHHLELPAEALLAGEPQDLALARWRAFLRPGEALCGWGYFTHALVAPHAPGHEWLDLRQSVVRALNRKAGGLDELAGPSAAQNPWARGRAGRRINGLREVLTRLSTPA